MRATLGASYSIWTSIYVQVGYFGGELLGLDEATEKLAVFFRNTLVCKKNTTHVQKFGLGGVFLTDFLSNS
jgi:hypothetical protein